MDEAKRDAAAARQAGEAAALSLKEVQRRVDQWIMQFEEGYFPPLASLARLMEEVGELARVVSHHEGFKKPKAGEAMGDVGEEMADVLLVLTCLANQQGIDLEEAMLGVLAKIARRDTSRWTLKRHGSANDVGTGGRSDGAP